MLDGFEGLPAKNEIDPIIKLPEQIEREGQLSFLPVARLIGPAVSLEIEPPTQQQA